MAKDRFSNQKPWTYSKEFKYGSAIQGWTKPKREILNEKQVNFITALLSLKLNEWEINFLKTILHHQYVPTEKQKESIKKIANKYNKKTIKQ